MKRSRRSEGDQQGRCSPGRIFLIPFPRSAACISRHQTPRQLWFRLHLCITPRQITYRSLQHPFFTQICITENAPTLQDPEAEEKPRSNSKCVTVDSNFSLCQYHISCFLMLVYMLYVMLCLSQFWERCPGMVTGFPLVGISLYSSSTFPAYLEFLLNSLKLWEPVQFYPVLDAQHWT